MHKQKYYLILIFIILGGLKAIGQEKINNTIYYEFGGTGFGAISINYERNISINDKVIFAPGLGFSLSNFIEVGGTKLINDNQIFIPWQVNFLFGEKNHHFETGFGMPLAINDDKFGFVGNIYVLRLGYRYQSQKTGFIFRASVNPSIIAIVPSIIGGISLGYSF